MVEPGRQYAILHDSSYHYGFNGKLHDDDIYGKDNSYDYGARFYDPRLGKFLSIDPKEKEYPWYSSYQFAGDKPIWAIDIDGLEEAYVQRIFDSKSLNTYDWITPNPGASESAKGKVQYVDPNGIKSGKNVKGSTSDISSARQMANDKWAVDNPKYGKSTTSVGFKVTAEDVNNMKDDEDNSPSKKISAGNPPSVSYTGNFSALGFNLKDANGGDLWSKDQSKSSAGSFLGGEGTGYSGLLDKISKEVKQHNDVTTITVDISLQIPDGYNLTSNEMGSLKAGIVVKTKEYLQKVGKVGKNVKINVNVKTDTTSSGSSKVNITTSTK